MLRYLLIVSLVHFVASAALAAGPLDLSGTWRFAMDPHDEGEPLRWYDRELTGTIRLPGSMAEQNLGDDVTTATKWIGDVHNPKWYEQPEFQDYIQPGNFKFPYWLTPKKHYVGAAWYQRDVEIAPDTAGKPMRIYLERAHWRTTAWLDDQELGTRDSLSTPHEYDLPPTSAGKHRLTIRVNNRLQAGVGVNAHSVSDHTQTNWNGIIGAIRLDAVPVAQIRNLQISPAPDVRGVRVRGTVKQQGSITNPLKLHLTCMDASTTSAGEIVGQLKLETRFSGTTIALDALVPITYLPNRWDEFIPWPYKVIVEVPSEGTRPYVELANEKFGFRDFRTSGTQFAINGRPAFLRGTLECCIFPMTGYPPMTVEPWRRILRIAKAHGLNHLRFHSWCPPEAAFVAADEMGIYYSIEVASWAVVGEDAKYEEWLYAEAERIVRQYGNHPSFCMMLYGNEPHGPKQKEFLAKWNNYWKQRDNRRLYSGGAGWPVIPENEFHITPGPRISRHRKAINTRINAEPPETHTDYRAFIRKHPAPVVSHEIGQWCVYPNLAERAKYTGALRALNFDIVADSLEKHHMLDQAHDFLIASGKAQAMCYKEEIESALRTSGMGGFQLLDLHDFPGQGTALVGVLDPFWDEKGYVTAEEYRRFAGETVPLARLSKRVFTTDEQLTASIEVTHFGAAVLKDASTSWNLSDTTGKQFASGKLPTRDILLGSATRLGDIRAELRDAAAPLKLVLKVSVSADKKYANSWDIWVYPTEVPAPAPTDILVTRHLDATAQERLSNGGKVLLMPERSAIKGGAQGPVAAGFSTIFWNTAWFPEQEPVTLGLLCDPKHPVFTKFPTESHTNWQWWYVLHRAQCMIMDGLPADMRPIIQMIDDWTSNRKLGLVFEAQHNGGKLLVCSADLESNLDNDPVARQMRASLLNYMSGDKFAPRLAITDAQLRTVLNY